MEGNMLGPVRKGHGDSDVGKSNKQRGDRLRIKGWGNNKKTMEVWYCKSG